MYDLANCVLRRSQRSVC